MALTRRAEVTFTVGIPGSGKSTWARARVARDREGTRRLNLDDVRRVLTGSDDHPDWSRESEETALKVMIKAYRSLIERGYDVVVDNTHVRPRLPRLLRAEFGDQVDYRIKSFLDVPLEICLERNVKRERVVPEEVVRKMYALGQKMADAFGGVQLTLLADELNRSDGIEPYAADESLPEAVIVDIDGTLALHGGRNPYDTSRYAEDTLEHRLARITNMLHENGVTVIVMSGRDSEFRSVTTDWLNAEGVYFTHLYMRTQSDTRRDDVVKLELFNAHVRGRYNVTASFDDRDRVVQLWRRLGLLCFQCAPGDF